LSSAQLRIPFEQFQLENGLQVILHHDSKLPVAHVNLWYHVGSKNERPRQTGFAHLFEHLMFQGSLHADTQYLTLLEKVGANLREGGVNGTTSFDRTNYFETVPLEALEYALWLESDRMGFLTDALTQEKLDNQRDVVKNERRQSYENVPYGRSLETILQNLFPWGHPYSWMVIGSQEDLDSATLEDFKNFFKTFYTPNNCSLVVAGDIDFAQTRRLVEKYFGSFSPGPPLDRLNLWIPLLSNNKRILVEDRVPQERLYLIWGTPPYFQSGDAELDLASRLLSHGKNSRLFKTLVYDRQIASDVSAFNYSLEIGGLFGVVATARPGQDIRKIEDVIREEMSRFAQEGPTEEELEREKAKHEFDFVSGLERLGGFGGKADLLNQYNTYLGSPDRFLEDYERYGRVTGPMLADIADSWLVQKPRLSILFAPAKGVRPSVAEPDRGQIPAMGPPKSCRVPAIQCHQLPNGLKLMVSERHDLPKISVGLVVNAGSTADPADCSGTAFMAAGMLDEGTARRSALEVQAELDRMGSILQVYAETEISRISVECLSSHLRPTLEIMADVILNPAFPEEELERLRKRRLDAILQEKHNPAAIARKTFRRNLFGSEHPLGKETGGTEFSIRGLRVPELREFYHSFWRPNLGTLVFVGDITMGESLRLAEQYFGDWPKGERNPLPLSSPQIPHRVRFGLIERQDAPQSQIRVGGLGPSRLTQDFCAIELMNSILGGSFSSRLNLNLREDKGFTYGAFSSFSYGRQYGLWVCGAAVHTQFTLESLREIFQELKTIQRDQPISEDELAMAKINLIQGYAQRFETLDRLMDQIAELAAFQLPVEAMEEFPASLAKVSLDEVRNAAQQYLDLKQLNCVVVGDLAKIEGEIRQSDF
jgi:zinc protease